MSASAGNTNGGSLHNGANSLFVGSVLGWAIGISVGYMIFVVLAAVSMSSAAQQAGTSNLPDADLLLIGVFAIATVLMFSLAMLLKPLVSRGLNARVNGEGKVTPDFLGRWVEHGPKYLVLLVILIGWPITLACEQLHRIGKSLSLSEIGDCYLLENSVVSCLLGALVGIFGAMYLILVRHEGKIGRKVYLVRQPPRLWFGWYQSDLVLAIGVGILVLYAFYRVFAL